MKAGKTTLIVLTVLAIWACSTTQNQKQTTQLPPKNPVNLCGPTKAELNTEPGKDGKLAPIFDGLDVYDYKVSTESELAQQYFNQGFLLNYGFNHAEASRSFREAIRQDPDCAMCYWGLAYVIGPNYNAPMDPEVLGTAHEAINNAKLIMHKASKKEQSLINALAKRYPKDKEADPAPFYEAYATAMEQVARDFPNDIDIQVMAAEAKMNLHPWDMWTPEKKIQPWTGEILDLLESALKTDPSHPQACHLYIHAMEAGPNPEKAAIYADNLRLRVPGSGHLLHMPSHLYINIGEYHKGTVANQLAVTKDSLYVEACHMAGIYPLVYYPHNWHFLAACAGLEGRGELALDASRYMAEYVVDEELLLDPMFGGLLQHFVTIPWFIQIKFGMWDEIMAEPKPNEGLDYPVALWHYARGMANASRGNIAAAQKDLEVIEAIHAKPGVDSFLMFVNTCGDVLSVAEYMLKGKIAMQQGDLNGAISALMKSVEYEDLLKYIEPPDWFFSVRHHLGNALLEAGRFSEAEAVYRKDLERYKENGWALKGLAICLERQGQSAEASRVLDRYRQAWTHADADLMSSVIL